MDFEATTLLVWIFSGQVLALGLPAGARRSGLLWMLVGISLFSNSVEVALAALVACSVVHALEARTSTWVFWVSAGLIASSGICHFMGLADAAFGFSYAAILLRAGVWPLHGPSMRLASVQPLKLVRQLATLLPLVLVHLRHLDHVALAQSWADWTVRLGALAATVPALSALVARDVSRFFGFSVAMHAGVLMMAVGAAGKGHYGAALFAAVTLSLALGGLGLMVHALVSRVGRVSFEGTSGLSGSLPKLFAGFLFFAGAGVGLPGTAGFVADDLLLHALWGESVAGTMLAIHAAAALAVASWIATTRVFFGPPGATDIPDLGFRERVLSFSCALTLVLLGLVPSLLMDPANRLLGAP